MGIVFDGPLTDSDVEWLNEPISYNPHSVHALMRSRERTPPKTDGLTDPEDSPLRPAK
jgi:hypothetical protein